MYIAEYEEYIGLYKVYIGPIEGVYKMYIVVYKVYTGANEEYKSCI